MKKIFLSALVILLQLVAAHAQADAIQYQAIARGKDKQPLAGVQLDIEVRIFKNGAEVFSEKWDDISTHLTGLFSIEIGKRNSSDFQKIDWSSGNFEMKVDVSDDLNIPGQRVPILSVPFAFHADRAANLDQNGATAGQVLKWDATAQKWLPAKDEIGNGTTDLADLVDVDLANLSDGKVLKWDAASQKWLPEDDIGGTNGDSWGSDFVRTDATLEGEGTVAKPLKIAPQNAAPNQFLKWSGTTWLPADVTVSVPNNSIDSSKITNNSISINDLDFVVPQTLDELTDVEAATPGTNQVLKWDGSKWTAKDDIGGGVGDDWGSQSAKTDATILGDGTTANPLKIAPQNATTNQFLKWNGTTWLPSDVDVSIFQNNITSVEIKDNSITINDLEPGTIPVTLPPSGAATGDLADFYPNPRVVKIQGKDISSATPILGQVLMWNGSAWMPTTISALSGSNSQTLIYTTGGF